MATTGVFVPRVKSSGLLPLQDQQLGLTQVPLKLLLLPWVPELVIFCVGPLRVVSQFPTAF